MPAIPRSALRSPIDCPVCGASKSVTITSFTDVTSGDDEVPMVMPNAGRCRTCRKEPLLG